MANLPVLYRRLKGELGEEKNNKRARTENGSESTNRILERGKMATLCIAKGKEKASILLRQKTCNAEQCASREENLCETKTSAKIKETP